MDTFAFPGNIDESLCRVAAAQVPYMRTAAFSAQVKETESLMLKMLNCQGGRLIPLTASGTGAMDAVAANYLTALGRESSPVVIVNGGGFGKRWIDLCRYYSIPFEEFHVDWGRDADYDALQQTVSRVNASAVVTEHDETSSGQLFNLERIGEICRANGASLVVDAISSFLADPLDMDAWGIDICTVSSQKGLNIHPGVAYVALSARLDGFPFEHRSFYFDFEENLKNLTRGQTPYSPATMIFLQALERLRAIDHAGGTEHAVAEVAERAAEFRRDMEMLGLEMPVEVKSNAVTGFLVPEAVAPAFFQRLMDAGFYVMPGGNPLYFRVSHMGLADTKPLIKAISEAIA